ncbi:high-potential iron-sulfur protein [Polaromonas sp. DSR2-3-2]|uniref:high-potential iron-sulfur protein n=1 Tax=unclassified Polaromonas TaxID=2638319 RepID=UPI003CF9ADA3
MNSNRRTFVIQSVVGASVLASTRLVQAQAAAPLVLETEPQAVALGYKADATKADKAKFPKYAAGQNCANCALYQGKPTDAAGACPLFAGKQVGAKAWCSAWAKKA